MEAIFQFTTNKILKYKFINNHFIIVLVVGLAFYSCKKNEIAPVTPFFPTKYSGTTPLVTSLPRNIQKPLGLTFNNDSIINFGKTCYYVPVRDGVKNTTTTLTLTGIPFNQLPANLLTTLCLGNKSLSELTASDSIKGWSIQEANYLAYQNGQAVFVNNLLISSELSKALSGVRTYFPDGYYSFVSSIDSTYNDFGWYQIAMQGQYPVAILYKSFAKGYNFSTPSDLSKPIFSYGIWGLDPKNIYILSRLGYLNDFYSGQNQPTVNLVLRGSVVKY